ncbi:hypothetical protein C8F01DRAFT_989789, partial [Mycena amicta]
TKARPGAIAWWVSRGRVGTPTTGESFGASIQAWWTALNPSWRRMADGGMKRVVEGGWKELQWPGVNGFMGLLYCLKWWGDGIKGSPNNCKEWVEVVEDVTWVLEQMPR